MTNPLLALDGLPDFRAIDPVSIGPAIETLLAGAYDALAFVRGDAVPPDYESVSTALDAPVERLNFGWNLVTHLQMVADSPALRESYRAYLPKVTAFYTALGSDQDLCRKYRAIAADTELSPQRARVCFLAVQSAQLSGAELTRADKQRFGAIADRSAALSQRFATNVLDATDRFACYVQASELDGVPTDVFEAARRAASADGREGCKLGLQASMYNTVMRHASNRSLREKLYHAYTTRASEFGPHELDNTDLMRELLALRHERALLLGMENHAQVSLAPKMAQDSEQVIAFLHALARSVGGSADREIEELRVFARNELQLNQLEAWDLPFVSERLRQARYNFSQHEVKRYFSVEHVLDGLLALIQRLFDVCIVRDDVPTWHDSVRAYRMFRHGDELGVFYLDLYARPGKRGGAWVNGLQARWRQGAQVRTALASVVCNFATPNEQGLASISHEELVTLFHEFGHKLHFMLSTVDERGISGFSGVEWDAIELPSQLMENLAWEWEVIESLSMHVDNGNSLPRSLFDKMLAAKNFQSGLTLLRQIEFALFDIMLHAQPVPANDVRALLDVVRAEVAPMPVPGYNRFANTFSHIFAGGYAAGYYSYLWAEVLSSDAWSVFEEAGVLHDQTWERFRRAVLEVGGSRPADENFSNSEGERPLRMRWCKSAASM